MASENAKATDPPSAEQKPAKSCWRIRDLFRKIVNRQTLMITFQILIWADRIARAIKRLIGDL